MSSRQAAVVGAGVMGEAMITGLIRGGFAPSSITIREKRSDRTAELIAKYGVISGSITGADLIFLAVKPQDAEETITQIATELKEGSLLISLLAGTRSAKIESLIDRTVRVVRVMPNTPLLLGKGAAAVSKGSRATAEDISWVIDFLSRSGSAIEVSESEMDAVTATSGSGPAYFFRFVEAMIESAKKLGLSQAEATLLARETLIGAAKMVEESGKEVSTLRENVTSPNGTTAAALQSFEDAKLDEIVYSAMKAARDRSIELSN